MTPTTAAAALIASALLASARAPLPPIACDPGALTKAERERHDALTGKLLGAAGRREELMNGYLFAIEPSRMPLGELAEWARLEARCCPFLDFGIDLAGGGGAIALRLTGRPEAKRFVAETFAAGSLTAAAAGTPSWVGRRIRVRYDDGDAMEVSYPSAGEIRWVGIGGRCKGESGGAAIEATEIASGVWLVGWTEEDRTAVGQIVDWRAGTILSRRSAAVKGRMRTRVRTAVFEPAD